MLVVIEHCNPKRQPEEGKHYHHCTTYCEAVHLELIVEGDESEFKQGGQPERHARQSQKNQRPTEEEVLRYFLTYEPVHAARLRALHNEKIESKDHWHDCKVAKDSQDFEIVVHMDVVILQLAHPCKVLVVGQGFGEGVEI